MMDWILGKLKWFLIVAAIGGPVAAYFGWSEGEQTRLVAAKGVEAQAEIVNATRKKGRRGVTTYAATLAWKDAKGEDRRVEDVHISGKLAGKLFRDDRIVIDRVQVKYLPEDTGKSGVVVVDDIQNDLETDQVMVYGGSGAGLVGILGLLAFFGLSRRNQTAAHQA